MTVLVNF